MIHEGELMKTIYSYTWLNAIEDGLFMQLSGPGYQGDEWIPDMVKEVGITVPVAMTAAVSSKCVAPVEGEGEQLAPCQDIKGRLWDVLYMLTVAARRHRTPSEMRFKVWIVPNIPEGSDQTPNPKEVKLCARLDAMSPEDPQPVMTIYFPEER